MRPNRPVIIEAGPCTDSRIIKAWPMLCTDKELANVQGTNEQWAASQDWVSSDGTVNIENLAEQFADAVVWATETNRSAFMHCAHKCHWGIVACAPVLTARRCVQAGSTLQQAP